MEPDDEFIFCLDSSAQDCWKRITKWAKQKSQKLTSQLLRESISLLDIEEFDKVEPDAFMRMICELLPFVGGSGPYMVFCIVRLVQELSVDDGCSALIKHRMVDFTGCIIDYVQKGLDSEDVKNLLGAAIDAVRALMRRYRVPLADYLCQFLTVAGADGTPLEVTRQLMAVTNQLLETRLERALRSAVRTQLDDQLPALLRLLSTCGDYDVQASLVECLFRLSTQAERPLLAAAWMPSDELRNAFVAISNFDADCRLLLNAFNQRLGADRKVHSFPADSATLAGYALEKPNDPDYSHLWVDFNEGSRAVNVYCQRPVTETQPDKALWETVMVRRDDVTRARLRLDRHRQLVTLTLDRPCRQLLSSGSLENFDGREVTFSFRKGHDLHTVLSRLYGADYKFQACEELASDRVQKASVATRGVYCRSTSASAPSATTVSSSAGGSHAASRQKASVPLSTVSSSGARPTACRSASAPKSSVPVLPGQKVASGGRYSPLEMRSPGRELHKQRAPSPPPPESVPAETVPVSQSSGPSIIEPTQRPPATSSGPSTPGVSSTAQACVRAPRSRRRPETSTEGVDSVPVSDGRQSVSELSEQYAQQEHSQEVGVLSGSEAQQHDGHQVQSGDEDEPREQAEDEPDDSGDHGLEIQDDVSQMLEKDKHGRDDKKEIQIEEESEQEDEGEDQENAQEDAPEIQEDDQIQEDDRDVELHEWEDENGSELDVQEIDEVADQYQPQKNNKSKKQPQADRPSSVDFEASPRASEPSSPAPVAGRVSKGADRSTASIVIRQRAPRRPRAAARPAYVEIDSSGEGGGHDSQETSPSPPRAKQRRPSPPRAQQRPSPPPSRQRRPTARDDNNNVTDVVSGATRQHTKHGKRGREPAAEVIEHRAEGRKHETGAGAKRQMSRKAADSQAHEKQGPSRVPARKSEKSIHSVSFAEKASDRGNARKRRSFFMADSSTEDSPKAVLHSIFSQSDSAESEFSAPRHRTVKRSRYPRSPHIFSDVGTSTDGEKLPAQAPPPQRGAGTFKRYPVYDPRSVRNKALLSQESWQTAQSQRGGRGRGGRGGRGTASRRGAASKRGATYGRGGTSSRGRGAPSVRGGAVPTKRGVSQSQPAGGWAERVSRDEYRLQSPEVLRDEPRSIDERDLSDVDVPPAKRRPDPGLASCFGWDSTGSESAVHQAELSPPVPAEPERAARRPSRRQRANRGRRTADPEPADSPTPAEVEPHPSPPLESCPSPIGPCPEPAEPSPEPAEPRRKLVQEQASAAELELSAEHELELSVPPAPAPLNASGSGRVSHLSVSATDSAPPVSCPPNTPLSAAKRAHPPPAPPTAAQIGDAMQSQTMSPQRVRPPTRDSASLTATQEFRLDDHLVLDEEASRPASPAPMDLSLHATDSPLPSPIRDPRGNASAPPLPLPPPPPAHSSQRRSTGAGQPQIPQATGEFRPPLPPPARPPQRAAAIDHRPLPANPPSFSTDDIRAELSGMVADWDTSSVRSEQQQAGPSARRQAVAAIRRQVARLEERDERLHQLARRSAATQERLLAQQRAAVATLEKLGEAAAAARKQAAERILAECERLERLERPEPGSMPGSGPMPPGAPAAGGLEGELQSVQRELDRILHAGDGQPQLEWFQY